MTPQWDPEKPIYLQLYQQVVTRILDGYIKEGEALLENFEETLKKPGQLTVGIGWYQWGGHNSDEEGVENVSLEHRKEWHRN